MEQSLSKNWVLAGLGVLVILGLKWVNSHWMLRSESFHSSDYSYQMAHVKSEGAEFDLSGRDIDRQVLTDEEKLALAEKKQQAAATTNTKQKIGGDVSKKDVSKKKKFSVNNVDTSREMGLSVTVDEGSRPQTQNFENVAAEYSHPQVKNAESTTPSKTKSAAEWTTLLSSHSTSQLVADFIAAHQSGDVSDSDFYRITFSLYNSQNSQNHQTGSDILTADSSINSFIFIANEYIKQGGGSSSAGGSNNGSSVAGNASALWTLLQSFAQPARFAALNQALRYSDQTVVAAALQILTIATQSVQQQTTVTAMGNGNTPTQPQRAVAGSNAQAFAVFVNNLTSISQSGSSNASSAQSLLTQVQTIIRG